MGSLARPFFFNADSSSFFFSCFTPPTLVRGHLPLFFVFPSLYPAEFFHGMIFSVLDRPGAAVPILPVLTLPPDAWSVASGNSALPCPSLLINPFVPLSVPIFSNPRPTSEKFSWFSSAHRTPSCARFSFSPFSSVFSPRSELMRVRVGFRLRLPSSPWSSCLEVTSSSRRCCFASAFSPLHSVFSFYDGSIFSERIWPAGEF